MWFVDSTGKLRRALVDTSGHVQIDVLSSPLSALIGEVQAAPTAYTVLDRLKTLATLLNAGLPAALDTGALKVREQSPITSVNLGNWPSDYPDAGMRKELDIHSTFTWEKFLREGVDSHFNARQSIASVESLALPSDLWTQTGYSSPFAGRVRCPTGSNIVCLYSKRAYKYPILSVKTQWPALDVPLWQLAMFGFENGAAVGSGLAMFRANPSPDLTCVVGGDFDSDTVTILNVTPANWLTAQNIYTISVQKHLIEFSINSVLVGLAIPVIGTSLVNIASPPYHIFFPNNTISPVLTSLIELSGNGQQLDFDISPFNFRVADGDPIPPRVYNLYQTGTSTLIAGTAIAAGSVTSHPFPLIGYGIKSIFFRASTAGTLSIQVLTQAGNWREYSSQSILANTLLAYVMEGAGLLGNVVFTPSSYPSTPSDAEVILQPWQ